MESSTGPTDVFEGAEAIDLDIGVDIRDRARNGWATALIIRSGSDVTLGGGGECNHKFIT